MIRELDELASRRVVLFGGKGGVGKTTVSTAAALHYARSRKVILFTTDPSATGVPSGVTTDASAVTTAPSARAAPPRVIPSEVEGSPAEARHSSPIGGSLDFARDDTGGKDPRFARDDTGLRVEALDAEALYAKFLGTHLESFLEIGDRGTYLDREELRRLFSLSMPGVDELMAWMHIGELIEENPDSLIVVDTAPTGHTLRMLSASDHFSSLASALDAMQEKHRAMVYQFTRRDVRDAIDGFIDDFDARAKRRRALLLDPAQAAFVPVMLSEPWVVEQTVRLAAEIEIDVPFVILNRAVQEPDCARCRVRAERDAEARARFPRVVDAPRSCVPLDTAARLALWSAATPVAAFHAAAPAAAAPLPHVKAATGVAALQRVVFFAGKGGVGKTTCSASLALQLAQQHPEKRFTVISVDPAHSLRDVFADERPPENLTVEIIDTRAKWRRFRDSVGTKIEDAFDALTPRGMSLGHDSEAMKKLIEIAPPGADELFAITRLADLIADKSQAAIIVDTAPTGHFLRLLDLPRAAGEWVREFMRLLLKYRELIPSGSLGEELVRASKALKLVDEALHSKDAAVFVVTRPERSVVAETQRLLANLDDRRINVGGVIANYLTPENECACDQSMREHELNALERLDVTVIIERRDEPVTRLGELAALVPLY